MFKTLAGYLGDMLSGRIKDERIRLSGEQSDDLRLKLANLVSEANRLRTDNEALITENGDLMHRVKQLEAKLKALREEAKPTGFAQHMGVLWKRTESGFEPIPYCEECQSHPIMTPIGRMWVCGNEGHVAPRIVQPPPA